MVGARPRAALISILASTLLIIAAACAGSSGPAGPTATAASPTGGVITVISSEWGFEPEAIILQQGQEVSLTLKNEGAIIHNLKVDDLEVDVIEENSSGGFSGGEGELFVGADSDDVGLLKFVPLEAGEYEFYCNIANHRQLGMEGRLTVQ